MVTPLALRAKQEAAALVLAFIPCHNNDMTKKAFALALLAVWCIVTVGSAFGYCLLDMYWYTPLTVFVFLLVGRLWGLEYDRLFKK
ncbi:MAG: hypothetical protein PHU95_02265 [Candidatus Thermoplasmatota archaeon]|nr:hypothetical protein [Candidatus Thermoplasmatota archaeon]MDD5778256.1 hypothetical protein [Candidatus Thermoplasmatota archaeon]